MNGLDAFQVFVQQHRNQLEAGGVPQLYWNSLFHKAGIVFRNIMVSLGKSPGCLGILIFILKTNTLTQNICSRAQNQRGVKII